MKIVIEKDNLDEFWVVTIDDKPMNKSKWLHKVIAALLRYVKSQPQLDK